MDELFPYQQEGWRWLASRRAALLADEMGLGKSAQAVTAADAINAERILVLCPAIARFNWENEFKKFSIYERPSFVLTAESQDFSTAPPGLHICSYNLAQPSRFDFSKKYDVVVLDEVHYLKNGDTGRTRDVFGANGLARLGTHVWALSGTPSPNHVGELWVLLRCFGATDLSYGAFEQRYCRTVADRLGRVRVVGTRLDRADEIQNMLGKCMMRRTKAEVMKDLPTIFYQDVVVEAGPVHIPSMFHDGAIPGREYDIMRDIEVERTMLERMIGVSAENDSVDDVLMERLRITGGMVPKYRRYIGMQKIQGVADLVASELEVGAYDKIVLFAHHRTVIEGLRFALRKFNPVTLYGATPTLKREANLLSFREEARCKVFIGHIQAAGVAVNLTVAHNVIVVEPDYVPGVNAQAIMRCHRIGQTKPVFVRFVALARDRIDARITSIWKRKARELTKVYTTPINSTQ